MSIAELKENTRLADRYFPLNVFHNRSDGGTVLHLHWHDHLEMIYLTEGEAVFDIGGHSYTANKGDLLFVNGGQLHSGYSIHNRRVRYTALVFHPSLLAGSGADPHYAVHVAPYLNGERLLPRHVPVSAPLHAVLEEWLLRLVDEFGRKETAYESVVKAYLSLILSLVARHDPPLAAASAGKYRENAERFRPLLDYLEAHYAQKITVEEAAAIVSLSPYHLCKSFKKATGRTLVEFLQLIRMNRAEKLLKQTNLPVTEIAHRVGYGSINSFDKVFKKIKHYSPSSARKQTRCSRPDGR